MFNFHSKKPNIEMLMKRYERLDAEATKFSKTHPQNAKLLRDQATLVMLRIDYLTQRTVVQG